MLKLRQFKYNERSGEVTLTLHNDRGNESVDTLTFATTDRPSPALEKDLQALVVDLVEVAELPEDWKSEITVRGCTVTYGKNGRMGLVIRGIRELEGSKTPLAINTPFFQEEFMDDDEAQTAVELSVFGAETKNRVLDLEKRVIRFFNGHERQQLQLGLTETAEAEEPKSAAKVLEAVFKR